MAELFDLAGAEFAGAYITQKESDKKHGKAEGKVEKRCDHGETP